MWNPEERIGDVEIEPNKWISFLDGFSRQHQGWLASIDVATGAGKLVGVLGTKAAKVFSAH